MGESPGRRGQGRVYKGPPIPRASLPKGVPSIPTKYETVVTQPIKEKDGFGTSTQRFTFSENAQPGPGSYHQQLAWVNDSGSMSKKGMGSGFVSKHQRFTFKPSYTGPGPGQYNSHVRPEETKLKVNHATTSAAFAAARSEGLGPPLPVKASRVRPPHPLTPSLSFVAPSFRGPHPCGRLGVVPYCSGHQLPCLDANCALMPTAQGQKDAVLARIQSSNQHMHRSFGPIVDDAPCN